MILETLVSEALKRGSELNKTGRQPADRPTRSQAQAAKALAAGETISEAAKIAGIKPPTLRAYLKTDEGALNIFLYKILPDSSSGLVLQGNNSGVPGISRARVSVSRDKRGRLDIAKSAEQLLTSGLEDVTLSAKERVQTGAALLKLSADLGLNDANEETQITAEDRLNAARLIRLTIYHTLNAALNRPAAAKRALRGAATALNLNNPLDDDKHDDDKQATTPPAA